MSGADGFFFNGDVDLGILNVHLISGEDIIGHVFFNPAEQRYRIEKPVFPNVAMDPNNGQFRVGLLPLRPYLEKLSHVDIQASMMIYAVPCGKQMETLYTQATSEIQIATPQTLSSILGNA
jgi:hypothetical protein